jgi:hypothetical protein
MMCLLASYKKNMKKKKYLFASLKSIKKEVGSGDGSGSISHRDPDPHQNVMDPQNCLRVYTSQMEENLH